MKYVRFILDGKPCYGVLENNQVELLEGDIFTQTRASGRKFNYDDIELISPCQPTKAVCVGLNYRDHAAEMKSALPVSPLIFIKPSSSINNPGGIIEYPTVSQNVHFEAELAVVIKKDAKHVKRENAVDYILGYTCANDVTARDIQKSEGQWTRGKSCDTFLPLGPCIATNLDPSMLEISLYLNGERKQHSNTSNLIFTVPELLEFITQTITMYPGDVILTGTPSGVGPMQKGDVVAVEIAGIGKLENTIV